MKNNTSKKDRALQGLKQNFNDYSLLFIVLFLLAFGLVLLYSTTSYRALIDYEDSGYYLKRQLAFTAGGLVLMGLITVIPYRFWRFLSIPAFLVAIGLILLTLREDPVNGARRWLHFGSKISFQPSEAAKVAIIIFTAFLIEIIGRRRLQTIWGFLLPMVPAVIIAILLWKLTNNLSSALIILAIAFGMIFVACPDYKRFVALAVAGVVGCIAGVTYIVRMADPAKMGFRSDRVLVWLDPQSYAGDTGYQTLQAISIMVLFILLIWRFMLVAGNAQDLYGALIVTGVVTHIAVQVVLNIAVVTNTIPNTGVTLPFISYGGSSLFLLLAEIGMVMSVARRTRIAEIEATEAAG